MSFLHGRKTCRRPLRSSQATTPDGLAFAAVEPFVHRHLALPSREAQAFCQPASPASGSPSERLRAYSVGLVAAYVRASSPHVPSGRLRPGTLRARPPTTYLREAPNQAASFAAKRTTFGMRPSRLLQRSAREHPRQNGFSPGVPASSRSNPREGGKLRPGQNGFSPEARSSPFLGIFQPPPEALISSPALKRQEPFPRPWRRGTQRARSDALHEF